MRKVIWPGLLAGVVILLVGMGLGFVFNFVFPQLAAQYTNEALFRPWSEPLMMLYYAYPFVVGLVLSWAWHHTKQLFKGSPCKRAMHFGFSYWFVCGIPGMLITYSSFKVTLLMVCTWLFQGLVNGIISGCIFAKLNK